MPRRASTCAGHKKPPSEWCDACKQKKSGCVLQMRPSDQPPPPRENENNSLPNAQASGAPGTAPDVQPLSSSFDSDVSRGAGPSAPSLATESARQRKQPVRFEPDQFWQRELPEVALDMGTQRARASELASEREQELQAAYEAGIAETAHESEIVVAELRRRMDKMFQELQHEQATVQKLKAAQRAAEAAKRQKTMTAFFQVVPPVPGSNVRPRGAPAELGNGGYTQRNVTSGCFAQHLKALEDQIISISGGDALKQLQLAAAISQRMNGIRQLRDRDMEAWGYVRNSLKAFFEKIHERHLGRFPQHMRAAQQAVCSAIANAVPPRKLHVLAEEFNVTVESLSEGRRHWEKWLSGDRESIQDLAAEVRSDKMDDG